MESVNCVKFPYCILPSSTQPLSFSDSCLKYKDPGNADRVGVNMKRLEVKACRPITLSDYGSRKRRKLDHEIRIQGGSGTFPISRGRKRCQAAAERALMRKSTLLLLLYVHLHSTPRHPSKYGAGHNHNNSNNDILDDRLFNPKLALWTGSSHFVWLFGCLILSSGIQLKLDGCET